MALNDAALTVAGNALSTAIAYLAIHTGDPGSTGLNPSSAARKPVTWTNTNGDLTASNIAFTGGTASGPAQFVGYWSAVTGGTFYGSDALTGDQTFNASGEYTITSAAINGSST